MFSIGHSRKPHKNNGTQYMYHWNEPYFTPSLCPRNLNDEFRAIKVCIIKYLYKFVNNSCLSDASQFSENIYFNLLRPKLKSTYQNKHELCTSRLFILMLCCMLQKWILMYRKNALAMTFSIVWVLHYLQEWEVSNLVSLM